MLEQLAQGYLGMFHNLSTLGFWWWLLAGIVVGLILGVIPGIGGMTFIPLFLPFALYLEPLDALTFIIALSSTTSAGGAITAVLAGVPGESANIATMIDGYPMTKKGQGSRALGAALGGSSFGSILAGLAAAAMIPLVLPMIMAVRSADMVFVVMVGLTFIAALSSGSTLKGLISAGMGVLVAFVGYDFGTLTERFMFGSNYLYDGIPTIPVALGLMALPPMIDLAMGGGTIARVREEVTELRQVWEGYKDVFRHWKLSVRCSLIGYIIGIIPGIGSGTAIWVTYAHAKQSSKTPEKFGTGMVEGVIAPQCAADAKEAGSLLTTMALGLPGSAMYAIILMGFYMVNVVPGPSMLTEHLDLTLTLEYVIILASIIGEIGICFTLAPQMAKLAYVPARIMVPIVISLVFLGAYASNSRIEDVLTMVIFAGLGLAMIRLGYNRAAFIIGFILGGELEHYLRLGIATGGAFFFMRPISIGLIALGIAVLAYEPIKGILAKRRAKLA